MAASLTRDLPQLVRHGFAVPGRQSVVWPLAALVLCAILQLDLVLHRAINWDEFFYYSQVEEFTRGGLIPALQTIHVHLFQWLTILPGNGVEHIVAGRLVMFLAELVTLAAISGISAHFTDRRTGLLCALAYLTSVYAFQHGFSFRVDPLATALTMSALYVLLTSRLQFLGILAFSLLLGFAGMVTIKAVLYAPAFAGVAWLRLSEADRPRRVFVRLSACLAGTTVVFCVLYGLHSHSLHHAGLQSAGEVVDSSANYAVHFGPPVYLYYLPHAVRSPLLTLLVLVAPVVIALSDVRRDRKVALLGLAATGLAFFVYTNTLAYFYAFILPPMVCSTCVAMRWVVQRYGSAFVTAMFAASVIALWVKEPVSPIDKQRTLLEAANEIFPQPVAYFDFCGMLGTFEKANAFMTTWGMQRYTSAGIPAMRQRMERDVVPLVLASEQQSYLTFAKMLTTRGPSPYFVEEDAAALRDNYLPFWGPFWLAGKAVPGDGIAYREEFLVPGPYTVRDAPVRIDGEAYVPGAVVHLERGIHLLQATGGAGGQLIWGKRLRKPDYPAPERPYWTDF